MPAKNAKGKEIPLGGTADDADEDGWGREGQSRQVGN